MGLRYNPFTGSFDLTRSPGSYLDGEVATYGDLPLDTAAAPLNSAWLVRGASGLWLLSRKPAGIYIRTATTGVRDDDYTYAGTFPDVFSDANFVVYNDTDSTKNLKLDTSAITTGQTRTLTVPDKSGTIATTSDLPDDYTVVSTAGNIANGDRVAANTTSAAFTLTLPASPANGDTIYVLDYAGTFASNNLTIARNGNNIESLAEDLVCNVEKAAFSLVYVGSTVGWKVIPQTAQMPSTSLANTWQVNQTFNGTNNTAPNQTAASGSSVMTRQLTDDRYWTQPEFVTVNITNFTGATVGGFSSGQLSTLLTLQGQTNPNVISESHARFAGFPNINTAGARSSFNYSRRMRVKLWFGVAIGGGTVPDTTVHYIVPTVSGYTAGVPAHRSFGFTVGPTTINGFTHDGSNYATTSGVAWTGNHNYYGVLQNDGAGNYSFWLDNGSGLTSLGTLTGPTGTHGAEHLFGANVKSTAINNTNFYYTARSLEISTAAS